MWLILGTSWKESLASVSRQSHRFAPMALTPGSPRSAARPDSATKMEDFARDLETRVWAYYNFQQLRERQQLAQGLEGKNSLLPAGQDKATPNCGSPCSTSATSMGLSMTNSSCASLVELDFPSSFTWLGKGKGKGKGQGDTDRGPAVVPTDVGAPRKQQDATSATALVAACTSTAVAAGLLYVLAVHRGKGVC